MTLSDFVQPQSPYRPWVFVLGGCLLACLPPFSRRLGGIAFFVVIGVGVIYFFLTDAFVTFAPSH